jgi:hypothetical protein
MLGNFFEDSPPFQRFLRSPAMARGQVRSTFAPAAGTLARSERRTS